MGANITSIIYLDGNTVYLLDFKGEKHIISIPNSINKILYSRVNMGAVVNYQLIKIILLEVFGGISTARKYKLETATKVFYNYPSEKGGFFNVGILLTPPSKAAEDSNADN